MSPRTVVVAKHVPWPPNSGEKWRTLGLVRAFAEVGPVTVCGFAGSDEDPDGLRAQGVEVRAVHRDGPPPAPVIGLARTGSLTAARFWDDRLHDEVVDAARDADVLVLNHVQSMAYRRGTRTLTVLDMHNVESDLTRRMADASTGLRRAVLRAETRALARLERRADPDVLTVVSETDRDRLPEHHRDGALVVPNAWAEPRPLAPASDPVVTYVGLMSWAPNSAAAVWFATAVWPRVLEVVPAARLRLVGRQPTEAVRRLAGDSIEVTGGVPDLEPHYRRTRVALAPLLTGGGSRIKILEALGHGRPVVATSIGAEGLDDLVGHGVLVADEPAAMAAHVVDLLDPARSAAVGAEGARAVGERHSWSAATRPLVDRVQAALSNEEVAR